jgi:hypothetical protein
MRTGASTGAPSRKYLQNNRFLDGLENRIGRWADRGVESPSAP